MKSNFTSLMQFLFPTVCLVLAIGITGCDEDNSEATKETNVLTFAIKDVDREFTVNKNTKSVINVKALPFGYDITNLVATFTVSDKATVTVGGTPQVSGKTANDFSSPVTYKVTADDGKTSTDFVVTVKVTKTAWSKLATNAFVKMTRPSAFAYDNKLWLAGAVNVGFVASPLNIGEYHEYIYSSADGATWNVVRKNTVNGKDSIPLGSYSRMVPFKGKLVTLGGYIPSKGGFGLKATSGLGSSVSSDGGKTWSAHNPIGELRFLFNPQVLLTDNALFLVGFQPASYGAIQAVRSVDVYSSSDGSAWNKVADTVLNTLTSPQPTLYATVYFKGAMYIAGGVTGAFFMTSTADSYSKKVFKSANGGATWEVATEDGFPQLAGSQIVEYKGKLYAIAGGRGNDTNAIYTRDIYVSEDATTWTSLTGKLALPDEFEGRAFHNAVVMDGKIYIIGGENEEGGINDVWVGDFEN